jgi:serine/threonine-protein kinase HipA
MVAYACAIENGDAHLKNFSVIYESPLDEVNLAPAYDLIATTPYIPKDTLALTLDGSKRFPDREQMIRFIRLVTGKGKRAAIQLLDQVAQGVTAAIREAKAYGRDHRDARGFTERLVGAMSRGLGRLA